MYVQEIIAARHDNACCILRIHEAEQEDQEFVTNLNFIGISQSPRAAQ